MIANIPKDNRQRLQERLDLHAAAQDALPSNNQENRHQIDLMTYFT